MMLLHLPVRLTPYVVPKQASQELEGPQRLLPPFKGEHLHPYRTQGFIECHLYIIFTNLTKSLNHGLKYLWVWNFIQFIIIYQGENKNIPKRDIDDQNSKYVST